MTGLIWVLTDSLGRESDAERRRQGIQAGDGPFPDPATSHEPPQKRPDLRLGGDSWNMVLGR